MQTTTLIIAGYGSMGQAFTKLYGDQLRTFRSVHILDLTPQSPIDNSIIFHQLDITNTANLKTFLSGIKPPALFLNLTAAVDTARLRQTLAHFDIAYLDTACSTLHQSDESRYSILMPHTYTNVRNQSPHLLCCGLNPGLVEILIRKLIRDHFQNAAQLDINLFEKDTLSSACQSDTKLPVSWSPATLIDEVLLSPTLQIRNGCLIESPSAPTKLTTVNWFGRPHPARLVGHEEIWNMQSLNGIKIRNCAYAYTFSPPVMNALNLPPQYAQKTFYVPAPSEPIHGTDQLVIKITNPDSGHSKCISWNLDHRTVWNQYNINAVQFQVCASIRLFCEILASERFSLNQCRHAANIPISDSAWNRLPAMMAALKINWNEIPPHNIEFTAPRVIADHPASTTSSTNNAVKHHQPHEACGTPPVQY